MSPKKKNPLYVVTNKGNVVEEASDFLDVLIKKLNLAPVIEMLKVFVNILKENVKSYAMFVEVKKMIDGYLAMLQPLFMMLFPKKA